MEREKQVLKLTGISKIYPNGKKAVSNLNLTMYNGQIFALLGIFIFKFK